MAMTGEEVGYRDAMRQVQRSLQRRLHMLQEEYDGADADRQKELRVRMDEVKRMQHVVESLHR
ncbi:hypothetical protein GCM10025857_28830 [Alicyclobacillus contaminans]|uniref:hypothetical protein n=1 Tax=Alicyclobacillus contaminans TaxID=392016 RepID=UPI0003FFB7F8|nr:hypothetical protein [Alicyclobacillus contaminans]GMA51526.1 hypothetical protein GCM10025857_28830 [Alicyclobacillus contaminans]